MREFNFGALRERLLFPTLRVRLLRDFRLSDIVFFLILSLLDYLIVFRSLFGFVKKILLVQFFEIIFFL